MGFYLVNSKTLRTEYFNEGTFTIHKCINLASIMSCRIIIITYKS